MSMLVIGGSGLVGYKIADIAKDKFDVYTTYNNRPTSTQGKSNIKLNKCDAIKTWSVIKAIEPDIVIDTAALHNVNYCETHREEAWKINVEGTRNIAEACMKIGSKLIFISTDYVFDGVKGRYSEKDEAKPLNYYGTTKLEAEKMIKEVGVDYIIARPSVIYGWNPSEIDGLKSSSGKSMNFVLWALGKLKNGEEIRIVNDQYSSVTFADNLAEALVTSSENWKSGVYHMAGKNCLNRFDFALKIAEVFGLDRELIKPATSDEFKQLAKRPMNCCLDSSKAEETFKIKFLTAEEGLRKMRDELEE